MQILFRVDASLTIGSGHVVRCLTIADALVNKNCHCHFACRPHAGNLIDWIAQRGHSVIQLPSLANDQPSVGRSASETGKLDEHSRWLGTDPLTDANETLRCISYLPTLDWMIIDHYGIDTRWQAVVSEASNQIMVIDDLANRPHDCDLLLDQNDRPDLNSRYQGLTGSRCQTLLGPQFALLRPEFAAKRAQHDSDKVLESNLPQSTRPSVLVFFGGMDEHNVTSRVLAAIADQPIDVHVVLGGSNPHRDSVQMLSQQINAAGSASVFVHVQVADMATLMSKTSLAIASGGTNTWERCCLGIPTATITVAANQVECTRHLAKSGVTAWIGKHDRLSDEYLKSQLQHFLFDSSSHQSMRVRGCQLVDGSGADRVVETLERMSRHDASRHQTNQVA